MNGKISVLPKALTEQLGTQSRLEWLLLLPYLDNVPSDVIFQHLSESIYHFSSAENGLTLAVQCLNPTAAEESLKWGLQSFTLDAYSWQGPWIQNTKPRDIEPESLMQLLSPSPDEVMHMHPMLCFPIEGKGGQTWGVVATFDQQNRLSTFSLVHSGEWREAAPIPQPEQASAVPVETPTRRSLTCRSGARTPESGIWEGRLPSDHPRAHILADAPHRFVYKRAGDAMGILGLAPFDEATVVWTWLRA
ncbi:hypothetical protein [Delftia lacustris]|uniref:Uncharacterized protein n=1 Tax=Delftia lacustris TaxID=558537 RepID=A0A1H3UAL2_9BURK|nr:hypothetical protein [Delftia lacustris]SDZ59444.1 hypothetical protein SAMN05421547_14050 [Delftia lacustris]